jgi:3'(2'),5'-bisphosphate nucleotidase
MTTASDSLLDSLVTASVAAGREILAVYAAPIAVEEKPDHSPVTEADRRAEQVILAALAVAAPGVPVVAEESVAAGIVPEIGETFFLVDPLDGTKEFIERNGEFTVNIALIEAGVPVMGVVYVPVTGEVFIGGPDGAFAAQIGADGRPGPYRRLWASVRARTVRRRPKPSSPASTSPPRALPARRSSSVLSPPAKPTSIRASRRPWSGTRRRAMPCCGRPAAA